MDTGKGTFAQLQEEHLRRIQELRTEAQQVRALEQAQQEMEEAHPAHGGWFQVSEVIELRGSRFRVKAVKPTELRLKLLPRK